MTDDRDLTREMNDIWSDLFGQDSRPGNTDRFIANVLTWLAKQGTVTITIRDDCYEVLGTAGRATYAAPDESLVWALIGAAKAVQVILEDGEA